MTSRLISVVTFGEVNFNKNLRGSDGRVPSKGDANYVKPQDRPFAEQKIGLLPDHFVFQKIYILIEGTLILILRF